MKESEITKIELKADFNGSGVVRVEVEAQLIEEQIEEIEAIVPDDAAGAIICALILNDVAIEIRDCSIEDVGYDILRNTVERVENTTATVTVETNVHSSGKVGILLNAKYKAADLEAMRAAASKDIVTFVCGAFTVIDAANKLIRRGLESVDEDLDKAWTCLGERLKAGPQGLPSASMAAAESGSPRVTISVHGGGGLRSGSPPQGGGAPPGGGGAPLGTYGNPLGILCVGLLVLSIVNKKKKTHNFSCYYYFFRNFAVL